MSTTRMVPRMAAALLVPGMLGLVAGPAWAQSVEGDRLAMPPSADGREGEVGPDGVYTVKRGDTLWDLSQQYLQNPWYWPKIWADNPQVENPHWIYPGDRLRMRLRGEAPDAISALAEEDEEETVVALPRPEVADISTGSFDGETLGDGTDLVSVSGGRRLSFQPPASVPVRLTGLITDRELAESGTVVGSFEEKTLLTTWDQVYVRFADLGQVGIGETFTVFRSVEEVIHPLTKKRFGHKTELLGTITVLAKEGDVAVAEINQITDTISRGDRVGPATTLNRDVKPSSATADGVGVVLSTYIPDQKQIAERHVVYVDLGSRHGLREGNLLGVFHRGDGTAKRLGIEKRHGTEKMDLPWELVATLMVFDVRDDSAAATVLKSVREVEVGHRVVLRSGRSVASAAN